MSYVRNHCLIHGHKDLYLYFPPVLWFYFMFRSVVHFLGSFCARCEVGVQIHSFAYGYKSVPIPFVEKTILSPIELSWHLAKNQLTKNVRVYFWTLSSIPLSYMSVLTPVPHFFILISIYLDVLGLGFSMWDLVSWPEIQPRSSALGIHSVSQWTTGKSPTLSWSL